MDGSRRGFLAKLGAIATAPVLTAFVSDKATGLAVPDTTVEVAKDVPEAMVISSRLAPVMFSFQSGQPIKAPDAMLPIYVNGKRYAIQVWEA